MSRSGLRRGTGASGSAPPEDVRDSGAGAEAVSATPSLLDLRLVFVTGKGGVGKSTVASGTAALAAAAGHRTLVLSTDAAHSLADAFGTQVGPEPTRVADNLFVQQVDAQLRFEQSWAEIQRYLLSVLDVVGVDPVAAEELTVLPGAEEVLALLELRLHARSDEWDVIVVDCAPTAETLRLLALPEKILCRPDCAGLCPVCAANLNDAPPDHHHEAAPDLRWEKLRGLKLE